MALQCAFTIVACLLPLHELSLSNIHLNDNIRFVYNSCTHRTFGDKVYKSVNDLHVLHTMNPLNRLNLSVNIYTPQQFP